jgi:prepilin-type processing-associated H-X9-DG protein
MQIDRLFIPRWSYWLDPRHDGRINLVLLDGAAESWDQPDAIELDDTPYR